MKVICKTCEKEFNKSPSQIKRSINNFCTKSCAATFNNKVYHKRKAPKLFKCRNCNEDIKKPNIFCNSACSIEHKLKLTDFRILAGEVSSPQTLKSWALRTLPNECSICKIAEWTGKPVPLVLDHVDGHSENNFPSNLRLVCGNCDMLLPTYKNKNNGNGRAARRQRYKEGKSY